MLLVCLISTHRKYQAWTRGNVFKLILNKQRYGYFAAILMVYTIEIGLEQAPFVFLNKFYPPFEHVKSLLIMGPNNTKNSSLKCDFHIINYEKYCQNLVLIVKKHQI
jgi:hypothetical protein